MSRIQARWIYPTPISPYKPSLIVIASYLASYIADYLNSRAVVHTDYGLRFGRNELFHYAKAYFTHKGKSYTIDILQYPPGIWITLLIDGRQVIQLKHHLLPQEMATTYPFRKRYPRITSKLRTVSRRLISAMVAREGRDETGQYHQ